MLTGAPSAGRFAPDESTVYVAARKALLNKIFSCTEALATSGDVKQSTALVGLLSESLKALQTLDALEHK